MTQSHFNINSQEDSNLTRTYNLIVRNYKLFLVFISVGLILTFLYNHYAIPAYRVGASLLILEENRPSRGNVNEYINNEMFGLNQSFQNEMYILKSTPVIEQTVKNLDLTVNYYQKFRLRFHNIYKNAPILVLSLQNHVQPINVKFKISFNTIDDNDFTIEAQEKHAAFTNLYENQNTYQIEDWSFDISGKFGELIETTDLAFIVRRDSNSMSNLNKDYSCYFEFSNILAETRQLKSQFDFQVVERDATIIEIGLRTPSVIEGLDIVNELMDVYSTQNVNRKNHVADVTIDYIERQLGEISDSLSQTEDNLQQFRSSKQLLDVTDQASNMSTQYIDLQNQLAELLTRKRYYDYLANYIDENSDFTNMIVPSAMGVQDPQLNSLVSNLILAQTQRSNLIENKQEKNPLVQRLEIQIENTKKTISENIAAVQKTTEISIDEMNKRINRIKAEISRLPKTQRQLGGIERKYRLNDAIYNYLLEKRAEAKISKASNLPDNIIVEPAYYMGLVSPKPKKNYIFALTLCIILPLTFVYFKSMISEKIEFQGRIDHLTDAPLLGKVPHTNRKTNNIVFEYPRSSVTEAYRAIRTNIEFLFKKVQNKVIVVSSSLEGEGKSFTALNLAMSYAQLGYKTLLADFDLRKPTGYFSNKEISHVGLTSYFTNQAGLDEIIMSSPHDKLDYIPSGPIPPNPVEMLASTNINEFIDNLKEQYNCIILDTTPLAQVSDAYLLMDYADIRIIVARYNYTLKKIFHMIMNDLKQKNFKNVCVVLNDNRVYSDQYGYGYGYGKKKNN